MPSSNAPGSRFGQGAWGVAKGRQRSKSNTRRQRSKSRRVSRDRGEGRGRSVGRNGALRQQFTLHEWDCNKCGTIENRATRRICRICGAPAPKKNIDELNAHNKHNGFRQRGRDRSKPKPEAISKKDEEIARLQRENANLKKDRAKAGAQPEGGAEAGQGAKPGEAEDAKMEAVDAAAAKQRKLEIELRHLEGFEGGVPDGLAVYVAGLKGQIEAIKLQRRAARPVADQLVDKQSYLDRCKKRLADKQDDLKEFAETLAAAQLRLNEGQLAQQKAAEELKGAELEVAELMRRQTVEAERAALTGGSVHSNVAAAGASGRAALEVVAELVANSPEGLALVEQLRTGLNTMAAASLPASVPQPSGTATLAPPAPAAAGAAEAAAAAAATAAADANAAAAAAAAAGGQQHNQEPAPQGPLPAAASEQAANSGGPAGAEGDGDEDMPQEQGVGIAVPYCTHLLDKLAANGDDHILEMQRQINAKADDMQKKKRKTDTAADA